MSVSVVVPRPAFLESQTPYPLGNPRRGLPEPEVARHDCPSGVDLGNQEGQGEFQLHPQSRTLCVSS